MGSVELLHRPPRHPVRLSVHDGGAESSTWSTSGMRAVYRSGVPDSVNTYNVPITSTVDEDSSRLRAVVSRPRRSTSRTSGRRPRKLTINVGLRFETTYGWQPATCQVETDFRRSGSASATIEGAPDFKALVPRVSAVYDLFGDGKTALKFSANRYDQPITLQNVLRLNPLGATSDTRTWTVCARGPDVGLRPQRRSGSAVERARRRRTDSRFGHEQPLRRRPQVADRQPSTASNSSGSFPATSSRRSATRIASRGATSAPRNVAVPHRHLHSAHRDRSEQRQAGDGVQPGAGAARQERHSVGQLRPSSTPTSTAATSPSTSG